jgi:hypothetical protein
LFEDRPVATKDENEFCVIKNSSTYLVKESIMAQETQMITIMFRHDQSKNLDEIQEYLRQSGFWREFPPEGIEIVSWYVMMGIGHVVTIKLPPERLREVNIIVEKRAWKAFTTEFYPSYDFLPFYQQFHQDALQQ